MGNTLQQYMEASRWHAYHLFGGQGIPRMLQGEILVFFCTFVSLRRHGPKQNRVLSHFQFAERFYVNTIYCEQFHESTLSRLEEHLSS